MNYNIDGPVMKRVVNVNNMKFKTRTNQSFGSLEPVGCDTRVVSDLHNFKPCKDITFAKTIANRKFDVNTFMKQTASELDIDDNLGIQKQNPLYQHEDFYNSYAEPKAIEITFDTEATALKKSALNRNESEVKKTPLELMFNRVSLEKRTSSSEDNIETGNVTRLDVKSEDIVIEVAQEADATTRRQDSKKYQPLSAQSSHDRVEESEEYITINDDSCEVYQTLSNEGTILPDSSVHSFKDMNSASSQANERNEEEDKNEYNISNFDSISLSSQTIQERKSAEISAKTIKIKKEMNDQFISLEIKPTDVLFNIIFTTLFQKFWVSGIKNSSAALSSKIHFGDEVLSINDYIINDKDSLVGLAKCSVGPTINLKLKRLPYGRVILINNTDCAVQESILGLGHTEILSQVFGIKLKLNTCKIEQILESGLFYKNGLKYDSNKVEFDLGINVKNTLKKPNEKDRLTKWVITEINGEYTNYKCTTEEILLRLRCCHVLSVVVQPYDLVKALFKDKTKNMLRSLSNST